MSTGPQGAATVERPEDSLTFDRGGLALPPWRMYSYWPTSMGWRMGPGDWYRGCWIVWYDRLGDDRQRAYRRAYPAPLYWFDFYWHYNDGPVGCLLVVVIQAVSLPVRLPAYWWYRIVRTGAPQ